MNDTADGALVESDPIIFLSLQLNEADVSVKNAQSAQ